MCSNWGKRSSRNTARTWSFRSLAIFLAQQLCQLKYIEWPSFRSTNWYCYGKAVAEMTAWKRAKELGVDLVVVNPVLVVGPLLQPAINQSTTHVLKYLTGSAKTFVNAVQVYVDVRDVAQAHLIVYETPSASGRYICAESAMHRGDVCRILAKLFPEYPVPTKCSDQVNPWKKAYKFTTKKIQDLGIKFMPAHQSLYETVKSLQEHGHLPLMTNYH